MGVENYIFWVWKRVRIWRTRQHTPTKNSQEHLPGRICCPLVFIAQRTQKAKWCLVYFQMRKTRKSGRVKDWVCNISTHEDFDFDSSTVEPTLRMFQTMQLWGFFFHTIFMHQSIPAAPSTPPGATAGHLPVLSVPGVGHLQILCCPGAGHLPTRSHSWAFDTHAVSYQKITTQRILLGKKADWLICQGQEKLKRFVKACSWFYACISSLLIEPELHSEIESYRHESTFFGYWIKFLLILFEKHPFIFIKLFITYNFTALY